RQAQHVSVIVAPAHLRGDAVVAWRRPHALDLVGGDAHADTGAAYEDAALDVALTYAGGHLVSEVGIIDAFGSSGAGVDDVVVQLAQEGHQAPLGFKSTMVAADGNFHVALPDSANRR